MNTSYNFPLQVAWRTLNLLINRKALVNTMGTAFYVWQRDRRIIVAFDPAAIVQSRVNEDFAHELSTILHGRRVLRTNSRGLFLQVGFDVPAAPKALTDGAALDLTQQPTPWHMPIGMTKDGPLWISLIEGDSFLVAGVRRKGKSGLTHGMIQALLHGGQTQVYAWDGKGGGEYQGYIGRPNFHFISNPEDGLKSLTDLLEDRLKSVRERGYPNIMMHNDAEKDAIQPIALIVDEISLLDSPLKEALKRMIEYYGAAGLYPVLATNDPMKASMLVKTNLSTRICFAVSSFQDSMTVLGMKGAESLTERGRGMIVWDARLIEFQSYQVTYPKPTEEARQFIKDLANTSKAELVPQDEVTQLAESIRSQWNSDMSKRAVGRLLGKTYAGGWTSMIDRIIEHLSATTATATTKHPDLPENGAVAG